MELTNFQRRGLMVNLRMYKDSDFEEIRSWYGKRNIEFNDRSVLSSVGFIAPEVAAAFLYLTNSSIGIFEGFITNPDASREDRHEAIERIFAHVIELAKEHGLKYLKGDSADSGMCYRAISDFGFKASGGSVRLIREL